MSTVKPIEDPERNPRVKAVFDDIRATRRTDFVNNLWRTLAFDPSLLETTWSEVKGLMATPTALDPLTKELIYTGITRARHWFSLVETRAGIFEQAVLRRVERRSGLREALES